MDLSREKKHSWSQRIRDRYMMIPDLRNILNLNPLSTEVIPTSTTPFSEWPPKITVKNVAKS